MIMSIVGFLLIHLVNCQNICDYKFCECETDISYIQCNVTTNSQLNQESNSNYTEEQFNEIDTLKIEFNRTDSNRLPNGLLKNLDLTSLIIRNFTILDYDFNELKSVKSVSLSNNNITEFDLEKYFSSDLIDSIEYVILTNNKISNQFYLKNMVNLNEIDLSYNKINEFKIVNLTSLDAVVLSNNKLTVIDFESESLTRLFVDNNELNSIKNVNNFKNLNVLKLTNNKIKLLENNTLNLRNLLELDLSHNMINLIEENSFKSLNKLSLLDLSYNLLEYINNDLFKNMIQLEKLYLQFNRLRIFSINYLSNLFILDLSNNRLKQIDYKMHDSNKLSILRLSNNNLTSAKFIEYLPNLQFVYLDNNYLSEIYSDISTLMKMDYSNQNGNMELIPNHVFRKLKNNQILLTLNLSLNQDLSFSPQSFCYKSSDLNYEKSFLDIYLSNKTVFNLNRCVFKQLGTIFKRTRLFVIDLKNLTTNDYVCKCEFRLFLSFYNIIIKNKCPRFSSYCYNQQFQDDCQNKKEFSC